jgi:hypothetical protein
VSLKTLLSNINEYLFSKNLTKKMKKVYVAALVLLIGTISSSAQFVHIKNEKTKSPILHNSSVARKVAPTQTNHSMSILWSDDFSNPSNWIIDSVPGTIGNWVVGFNTPNGGSPIDPINSATVGNGFALFDSDMICSGDQIANLTTANPINLSGHPYVRLSFSQYYRKFHDSTYVYISNNGTTWTRFVVNGNLVDGSFSANDATINPDITFVDISSVAGNQDSVYVRFQFYSPDTNMTSVDTLAGCGFSWMIDDISIYDVPVFDGSLLPAYCGEYSVIPTIQPEAFKMRNRIVNNGIDTITGAKIYFTVNDSSATIVYIDSTAPSGPILPGDTSAFLESLTSYIPTNGVYFVDQLLVVAGDSDQTNNVSTGFIILDDSTYARDFTALDVTDFAGTLGYSIPVSFGMIFHIYNASEFSSVSFFVNTPKLGATMSASIYNAPGGIPGTLLGTTPVYTITADDTAGALITLMFATNLTANPGDYLVAINQLDTNNMTLGISNNIYTYHAGFYKISTNWTVFENSNLTFSLMARVNNPSGTLLGVKETEVKSGFKVYPNPSSGMIYISGDGKLKKDLTIHVINNVGQVVKTYNYGQFLNGKINLGDLSAGMYILNFRSADGEENKNIILE